MTTIHDGSREALAQVEANVGFVPNLARAIAASPTAIGGFAGLQTALHGSSRLSALEREVVALTTSRLNRCQYALAANARFAAGAGGSPELITALREGAPLGDERLESLKTFTEALWHHHGHVETQLDAETALEVIAQHAFATFANCAAEVTGAPIDEAFRMS